MKAITIRKDGELLAFGPVGRSYDPGVPDGTVKAIEDDYAVVQAEYVATHPIKSENEILVDTVIQVCQNPANKARLRNALGI